MWKTEETRWKHNNFFDNFQKIFLVLVFLCFLMLFLCTVFTFLSLFLLETI